MTMIDEEVLIGLLRSTADDFRVSDDEGRRLVATLRKEEDYGVRAVRFVPRRGRTRRVAVGAAAAVLALSVGVPIALNQGSSPVNLTATGLQSPEKTVHADSSHGSAAFRPTVGRESVPPGEARTTTQRIESTGTVDLNVANTGVGRALGTLDHLAAHDHGYVESTQVATDSNHRSFTSGQTVLEIPQSSFLKLVSQVQKVGTTTKIETSSNNVTSEYVNYQARIHALRVTLDQYLSIMTHARTISDILAVQSQINSIQSQIDQQQGQLNLLTHETTYASLTVNVSTSGRHPTTHTPSGLDRAFHDSVGGFVAGFDWLIRLAGPVIFALIALGLLSLIVRYAWRGWRRRHI
ncbi:MAG TPA: DUF4349 domain-containing protein [Acidimicrobiales bacterium]